MNQRKTLIGLLLFTLSMNYAFAEEPLTCLEKAITQTEMNACAGMNLKIADGELNRVYTAIKSRYSNEKLFLKKLKTAQLTWIKLREADFEMQFPHAIEEGYYGSVLPSCANSYKTQLTLKRVEFLKEWIRGVDEGDTCAGSKQFTEETIEKQAPLEQCYQTFIGNTKEAGTIELLLTMPDMNDKVTGEYNYLPHEKDRRYGKITGTIKGDSIQANYTFEQEGEKDTVDLEIQLKNKIAFIRGNKKDEGLGLSSELKKIDCEH